MTPLLNRRQMLGTLVLGAALPSQGLGLPPRRKVAIVGGGMAGVSLAWLLDGLRDVVLLEARDSLGGNIQDVEVDLSGHRVVVDMGAQYFHPGPYPAYTELLTHLGLHVPESPAVSETHSFPASITVTAGSEALPRFVSPVVPERLWPFFSWWNQAGLWAFGIAFLAARLREESNDSWMVTLDEWLPTLGLSAQQWEGMLLPWTASLFSGSIEQARGLSARAAMIFAAKALPPNPLDPISYYVLKPGMADVLHRMVGQLTTATVITGARVLHVSREQSGTFKLHCDAGRTFSVDDLVLASSGPASRRLLESLPGTRPQLSALRAMEFHDARLALHTDEIYAPADPSHWSFLNCDIQGAFCEASMWLGPVLAGTGAPPDIKLFKSWATHRIQAPVEVLHEAEFRHMLPTPATISAQDTLLALQGRDGIWFAGGYLSPYDSQETALRSALRVAIGLGAVSTRSQLLFNAIDGIL